MKKRFLVFLVVFLLAASVGWSAGEDKSPVKSDDPFVVVLGIAQDVGYPHTGCKKECCLRAWKDPSLKRMVTSIAVVDPKTNQRWIFEATPDLTGQWKLLEDTYPLLPKVVDNTVPLYESLNISGFFLTHAHIGHYPGLMFIGREGVGSKNVPVYAMPRMREFIRTNGPWNQLVNINNIVINPIEENQTVQLNERLTVTAFKVPHREEYSEVVGFKVIGPNKSFVFIPDINKWEIWDTRIENVVAQVDYAFLDATFYGDGEIPGKSISEIPHPFVVETMERFKFMPKKEIKKIYFVHMNHTNPLLNPKSHQTKSVLKAGYNIPDDGTVLGL